MAVGARITLQDIATKAGVSRPLVSNILNGRGRASVKLRHEVETLLTSHGFRPKIGRRPFFLLERSHFQVHSQAMCMQLLSTLQKAMTEKEATLHLALLHETDNITKASLQRQIDAMLHNQPAGFILNTNANWSPLAGEVLTTAKVPFLQVGYDTECAAYPAVVVDSFAGAQMATRHLLQQGHRRIAILRWRATAQMKINSNKKFAGYQAALADAGLEVNPEYVKDLTFTTHDTDESARQPVMELLALDHPPTAVFVDNSYVSPPLLYPMPQDQGKLPSAIRDLAMIHFEDWPLRADMSLMERKLSYPACDTAVVAIDWNSIGEIATHRLIELARGAHQSTNPSVTRVSPILQQVSNGNRTNLATAPAFAITH